MSLLKFANYISLSVCLCVCLSVYLSVCLSICLSVCLSDWLILFYSTDEDQDLKLAIELSLRDAAAASSGVESPTMPCQSQSCPASTCSRETCTDIPCTKSSPSSDDCTTFSPEYSTIVTRVPNKSIEDLAINEASSPHLASTSRDVNGLRDAAAEPISPRRIMLRPNQMYFPGRSQDPGQNRFQGPKYHFVDNTRRNHGHGGGTSAKCEQGSSALMTNPFGIMKDISVNNIVASDKDKTKEFCEKDFSQLFGKKAVGDVDIEAVVFEPRPCPLAPIQQHHWRMPNPREKVHNYSCKPEHWPAASNARNTPSSGTNLHSMPRQLHGTHTSKSSHDDKTAPGNPAEPQSRQLNLEESLDQALQNLNDLTRNLTRDDSMDSIDMVIDSKVLESLLQGAEGYAKDSNPNQSDSGPVDAATNEQLEQNEAPPIGQLMLMAGRSEHSGNDSSTPTDPQDNEDAVYV